MAQQNPSPTKPLWLAIIVIGALLMAAGTAVVFHAAGAGPTTTLSAAGAAFVALMTISLAAWSILAK